MTENHPAINPTTSELIRARATLGDWELTILTDGHFCLDGGAMFGVVPKALWEKRAPADEHNRILLGANTVVARNGKFTVVIETGLGNKLSEKQRAFFGNKQLLPQAFAAAGITLDSVTHVFNSHLHFDHCGWNTTLQPDGSITPTFPNARYFAHAGEVEHGHQQYERDAVSYLSPNYDPLIESGQMTLLTLGSGQVAQPVAEIPDLCVELFPGHTAQTMSIQIASGGRRACYISDLIPTTAHLDVTWCMGYDLDPMRVIEERKRFYARAIPEEWLVLFTHDHHTPIAQILHNEKGKPTAHLPKW
jgi:glyoxylase-like metal-dependent hydrolase (beta-lactamase superfamily II)